MTHINNNGEWINDASKNIHMRVEEASSYHLEAGYGNTDKDLIMNIAFKSVVGERSGYCRGLGAGIKTLKGRPGLQEQLEKECEKSQDLEMKLKEVETQLGKERNMREEMTAKFEESQRQLGEKMEKQVEEKMANMFSQMMNFKGIGGQFSSALNIMYELVHKDNNMTPEIVTFSMHK
ncbi:uncharacterized protein [Medicago truncatula]|uniref:uncharacterized protein n=1 Tax=Medicago truncatula TaxID=3880 RepID=UPI0019677293|nr:uncharacterized protein LOC25479836 [Medicago truncatula]